MSDETQVAKSPLVRLLLSVRDVVLSKASPIADAVLFFFLVFLLSVAGHTFQDVYGTRQLTETFKHRLISVLDPKSQASRWPSKSSINHTYFKDISTHDKFWDYIQYNLADTIYPDKYYDGGEWPENQRTHILGFNTMVQKVRIRQKRVKEYPCSQGANSLPARLNSFTDPGLSSHKCYPKYSEAVEYTGVYQGLEWSAADMLMLRFRNPLQHRFQGGSYALQLPEGNAAFKARIQELKEMKWTDKATRAVFVDFSVLSLPRDQFVSVRYTFDFTEYGKIVPKVTIRAYRDRLNHEAFIDAVNYVSEFALYGIVAVNAFREVGRFRVVGPETYFSNIWNFIVFGVLTCCAFSFYYRVVIVRSQWSTIQGKSTSDMKWQLDEYGQYRYDHE